MAEIRSLRGTITARATVTERIRPGTVFLPMHWGFMQEQACEANALLHEQACPISRQPELKAAAVAVARVQEVAPVGANSSTSAAGRLWWSWPGRASLQRANRSSSERPFHWSGPSP